MSAQVDSLCESPILQSRTMVSLPIHDSITASPRSQHQQSPDLSPIMLNRRVLPSPWEYVLSRSIKAVVAIRVTEQRTFDTGRAGVYNASGFVVDRRQGLILSNRHVISPGPVVAKVCSHLSTIFRCLGRQFSVIMKKWT